MYFYHQINTLGLASNPRKIQQQNLLTNAPMPQVVFVRPVVQTPPIFTLRADHANPMTSKTNYVM